MPKNESTLGAITPKLCEKNVRFLYTVLVLIEIYLPVKFQVGSSYSFSVMLWTIYS